MDALHCPICHSSEVYHARLRRRRWLTRMIHPGHHLYRCHRCRRHFWARAQLATASLLDELTEKPAKVFHRNGHPRAMLFCPSCGTRKTVFGRWWDDFWTSYRGHNRLYHCRHCDTVFSPPP